MESLLHVDAVVKHFDRVRAVDGVSFEVRRGRITGLLGRNGAGKTTTIRMITSIFYPDSGTIRLFGRPASDSDVADRIGYLPEERGLYRKMKVLEHLLFLSEIKGRRAAEVLPAAEKWLRRMELWEKRDGKIEELSKGNQQKVQFIGALLHDPELLILDEPMSGLDPVNVVLMRRILVELRAEGKTILLSTHMMGEAERMADDIVLIHGGKVVLSGSLDEVRSSAGANTVQLGFEGDGAFLATLPGVVTSQVLPTSAELRVTPGTDPQQLLAAAMPKLRIRKFDVSTPSLEEVFISRVGEHTLGEEAAVVSGREAAS
jgi:ABC-2 type transport system ATP-binding protein